MPPLAGVDRPTVETVPDTCDVLICGTGLVESILAAALAWQGTNVLHIDANSFYGDTSACLNMKELQGWLNSMENGADNLNMNAQLYVPRPMDTKRYLVDLAPHVLFAKSDMLDLLIKSRVFKYLEFKPLGQFHTYQRDAFEKVSGNKQEIFTDQTLSATTKRNLMKFIKFIAEWKIDEEMYKSLGSVPVNEFLTTKFKLEEQQITELVVAIGLCDSIHVPASIALTRIRRYLLSLDIYGHFPVLYSMYGSGGELAQGFCRSAAVAGATYKLGVQLVSFDERSNIATLSDGSRVQVAEKVFLSPSQPSPLRHLRSVEESGHHTTRLVAVVSNECKEWFAERESAAIVVFPPGTLASNNDQAVHTVVYGPGSGQVPAGYSCWYLSTNEKDLVRARQDLSDALERLEASILRESTTDFDLGPLSENDVAFKPDGTPMVSSVRLGQSMQNFVPKQKLQYLFKLGYTQASSAGPREPTALHGYKNVFEVPSQLSEISYDGMVEQTRKLYEAVVGSDDDFFDVDFEDGEEDEGAAAGSGEADDDQMMPMDL